METDSSDDETKSSPGCKQGFEGNGFSPLIQELWHLHKLTEHALRKNEPLVILNLKHEKSSLLLEDLAGTNRSEHICLQALKMCLFPCGATIEISLDNVQNESQKACLSTSARKSSTTTSTATAMSDSELHTVVSMHIIQVFYSESHLILVLCFEIIKLDLSSGPFDMVLEINFINLSGVCYSVMPIWYP